MQVKRVAGMNFDGGRHGSFFLCIFEYFPQESRWALKTLDYDYEHGQEQTEGEREEKQRFEERLQTLDLDVIAVNFPLSWPACKDCTLECPGSDQCPSVDIQNVRKNIQAILDADKKAYEKDSKGYERDREQALLVNHSVNVMQKQNTEHIISRAFKRRCRKEFLPYWNRSVDLWVWMEYYDQLLSLFDYSYDSFKEISLILLFRFDYLKKQLKKTLCFCESNIYLILLELYRSSIISKLDLQNLRSFDAVKQARLNIIEKIEKHFSLFLYEKDVEILSKNQKAFSSFLLALTALHKIQSQTRRLPEWVKEEERLSFVVPSFEKLA